MTFNNLYASDFTFDSGIVENTSFSLSEPPHTPAWFANQPLELNTQYTDVEVSFNKRIASCTVTGVNVGVIVDKGVDSRGNRVFDVHTLSNQPSFNFFNVLAENQGRTLGPLGPLTTGLLNTQQINQEIIIMF